jgi:hypothetical protein
MGKAVTRTVPGLLPVLGVCGVLKAAEEARVEVREGAQDV